MYGSFMTPDPQPWEAGYKPMSAAEALDTSRPLSRHVAEGIARDFEMQKQANRCEEERHDEALGWLRTLADWGWGENAPDDAIRDWKDVRKFLAEIDEDGDDRAEGMAQYERLIALLRDADIVFEEHEHEGTRYVTVEAFAGPKNTGYSGFLTSVAFDADGQMTEWGAWE